MKKFTKVAMPMFLLSAFFLTSCGSSDDAAATEEEAAAETTDESTESAGDVKGKDLVKNVHLRKAISMGFDKDYLIQEVIGDGSLTANYFFPADFVNGPDGKDFRASGAEYLVYDVEKAKEEWELAKSDLGITEAEIDLMNYDTDSSKVIAEYIKSELEQNLEGLTININPIPFQQKLEEAEAGNFAINYAAWSPDYADPSTFFDMWLTGGSYNEVGYSSEEYDKNATLPASDEVARWNGFQEAERIMLEDDAIMTPLYQRSKLVLKDQEFTGLVQHQIGADYTFMWIEPKGDDKQYDYLEASKTPSLDPNVATDAVSFTQLNAINEGLLRLGKEGSDIIPGLAESFEKSEDGLTYTFKLRDGLKFVDSTGEAVEDLTAKSFVDSWDRLADEATASQYGYMVKDVAHIESYEAVDDTTLKVTLSEATPWFESILAFPPFFPIASEKVKELGTSYGTTAETTFSCGPFYLSEWNFSEKVIMTKNENYHTPDEVKLDAVNVRVIENVENNTAVNMYFNNELDRVALVGENATTYKDHADVTQEPEASMFYLDFNIGNEGKK